MSTPSFQRFRGKRGFSLVELTIASTISTIIVGLGFALATATLKANRSAEGTAYANARSGIVHAFLERTLEATGHGWTVSQGLAGDDSGSWGEGHCVVSTNICPGGGQTILPLQICGGDALTATACPTVSASLVDAAKSIVPRDTALDGVVIEDLDGPSSIDTACSSLSGSVDLSVKGVTSMDWAVGDLVLISKPGHVTVGRVGAAFAADTTLPPVTRTSALTLDIGAGAYLANDDGGRTEAICNAAEHLQRARVTRIRHNLIRVKDGHLEVAYITNSAQAAAPPWLSVVDGLDDMQFRLDIARFPQNGLGGAATLCGCDTSEVLSGAAFGATCSNCVSGEALSVEQDVSAANRLMGLRAAVTAHADGTQSEVAKVWTGMFDRTSVIANDSLIRRRVEFYVAFPAAYAF